MVPEELYRLAAQFPSMGGTKLGPVFREYVRKAPKGTAVVEVGCWLGAGTAQLALGIRERANGSDLTLHCYDRWTANELEIGKAKNFGLSLTNGEDLLPLVRRMLQPFDVVIDYHQGDLRQAAWDGKPISVYIDDASKKSRLFFHALMTFGPAWIPGETVIFLMDYHLWEKTYDKDHACQKEFFEAHADHFELIEHPTVTIFRYRKPVDFERWITDKSALINFDKEKIKELSKALHMRDEEIKRLRNIGGRAALIDKIAELSKQLELKERQINVMKQSLGWRIRTLGRRVARVFRGGGQKRT